MKKFCCSLIMICVCIVCFNMLITAPVYASGKVQYKMEKDVIRYKDKNGLLRGIMSFQYPQFKGNSSNIKKVNKAIKKKQEIFFFR